MAAIQLLESRAHTASHVLFCLKRGGSCAIRHQHDCSPTGDMSAGDVIPVWCKKSWEGVYFFVVSAVVIWLLWKLHFNSPLCWQTSGTRLISSAVCIVSFDWRRLQFPSVCVTELVWSGLCVRTPNADETISLHWPATADCGLRPLAFEELHAAGIRTLRRNHGAGNGTDSTDPL
jgi:hypothetical protein